jgi:acetyl-CoA synthetase
LSETIETLLDESRVFAPSDDFRAQANLNDPGIYQSAAADPVGFWEEQAKALDWFQPWHTAMEWNRPFVKWFLGGKLNACYNCVDRHAEGPRAEKVAILWEGEPGEVRKITYRELKDEVSKIANALKSLGVGKGDRVCIYLPMIPELAMTMLACARIGAAHSVVFGGFSADSLAERTNDAQAKVIVTADGGYRRGNVVPLLQITEDALNLGCPTVEKVLVFERLPTPGAALHPPLFVKWSSLVPQQSTDCPCEHMDSEDLLYILYTSGSTGKPKGIVHTT